MSTLPLPLRHRRFLAAPRRSCRQASRGWASLLVGLAAVLLWSSLAWAQVLYTGPNLPSKPAPANSIGVENSFYLDQTTGNIWGPKTLGSWPTIPFTLLSGGATFYARNFPSASGTLCTWDSTHDVGPCINSALLAAAAAGGGSVIIPCGKFGLATALVNSTSGVSLRGCGIGTIYQTATPYLPVTELVWTGTAGATMFDVEPSVVEALQSVNVTGIVFNANNLANYAIKGAEFTHSTWYIGAVNARLVNIFLTTETAGGGSGTQYNDFWLYTYSNSSTYAPTGILADGAPGSQFNVSLNKFHQIVATYNRGDGVDFGYADNNQIDFLTTFNQGSASSGTPTVFGVPGYIMPNGLTLALGRNATNGEHVFHDESIYIWVQGLEAGATISNTNVTCSSCGPTTIAATTNSPTSLGSSVLNFASVTGITAGELIDCGGILSGVPHNAHINGVGTGTLTLRHPVLSAVTSGTACTVKFGAVNNSAVAGAYVITAASSTTVNVTAPSGGHSQTELDISSGTLIATDLIMPWASGSMNIGDTWTVTLSIPTYANLIDDVDSTNSIPFPVWEDGATGAYASNTGGGYRQLYGTYNLVLGTGTASGGCTTIGNGANGCFSAYAGIGGVSSTASGFAAFGWGESVAANGFGSAAFGFGTEIGGVFGFGSGWNATDRNRMNTHVWGCQPFTQNTIGGCQDSQLLLEGTGNTTAAIPITADAQPNNNTNGESNCVNIPDGTMYALDISVAVRDVTTPTNFSYWPHWSMVMTRGTGAASVALTKATEPTPLGSGVGTLSATADTTIGCLNLSLTPPVSNTDTLVINARVDSLELKQ